METMAFELKFDTYEIIKNDIAAMNIPFLMLDEQERLMKSKLEHIKDCLVENEVTARIQGTVTTPR